MRLKVAMRNVTKSYGDLTVLNNCTQGFGGGVTAVFGANQSGKSTLLKICALLEEPDEGRVSFFYTSDRVVQADLNLRRKVTIVLPFGTLFNTTAWRNVDWGLRFRGMGGKELRDVAAEALNRVGLYEKRQLNVFKLTRGECRRLLMARATAIDPDVLLLDEPTRGLDDKSAEIIEGLIAELGSRYDPPTIVLSSMDVKFAKRVAKRILILKKGTFAIPGAPAMSAAQETSARAARKGQNQSQSQNQNQNKNVYINPDFFA